MPKIRHRRTLQKIREDLSMGKLNLPIIKEKLPSGKWLSMNDYLRFVKLHLKYTLDKKAAKEWKRLSGVNVPFVLR